MRPLAIVRPEPGASASAAAARKLGLHPIVMPLFEARPLDWAVPDLERFHALLFTSANALRHAGPGLRQLLHFPANCVGQATAAVARESGFEVSRVGDGGVDALLRSLSPELKLLHLCGADWREPDGAAQPIHHLPVYELVELPLPDNFGIIEDAVVAIHSPRAARLLAQQVDCGGLDRRRIGIAAISSAAADAAGEGWETVASAAEPTDAAVLAIAARLCNNAR